MWGDNGVCTAKIQLRHAEDMLRLPLMISPPSSASRRVSRASRSAARAWCRLLAKFLSPKKFLIENDMLKKHAKNRHQGERWMCLCIGKPGSAPLALTDCKVSWRSCHEPYMSWFGPRWCRHPAIPKDTIKLRGKWRNNLNSSQPLNMPPCLCFITSHLALCLHLHLKQSPVDKTC